MVRVNYKNYKIIRRFYNMTHFNTITYTCWQNEKLDPRSTN